MNYRVVEQPELQPGSCYLTRSANGPFIDTGLDIDDLPNIGRVYLAFDTISDLAQSLGYTPPEASKRGRQAISDQAERIIELEGLVDGLQRANAALIAAGYRTPDAPTSVPADSKEAVLVWVCEPDTLPEARDRAQAAWNAEMLEPRPRADLLTELEAFLQPEVPDGQAVSE